ncbi:hypothetical protein [Streptomyces flavidovirens]|uniref:hypothetical protein n=1 Tax=Streptomyces flavidovirens TaxID=67298 RepID=UPI00042302A8|nr:hypothetical protein [Streptomyces flavidovirens]
MNELTVRLSDAEWAALADLADAQGSTPAGVAQDAVRRHLHAEGVLVRAIAERIAVSHAELLRRLGE